ncbi:hypothetical protein [Bacteroides fragilis]|uniref:hypothetical protein n=1 Tax=Bacteroides fragilis TaxID=817 RepID=UPI00189FE78B|nr:hypothetical protein [Bacteroides fragilis]
MAKIKSQSNKYVTIKETEYLQLIENTMIVEALKIAGVENLPIYEAVRSILDDKRVQIHIKPLCTRYSFD